MSVFELFVYGTLKRGECREDCWPAEPLSIRPGFLRGALLDLGAYPGLIPGNDWVRGEIWRIDSQHADETLKVLDAVEGYQADATNNLYERAAVEVYASPEIAKDGSDRATRAQTYWLRNRLAILAGTRIKPQPDQAFVEWLGDA